MIVYMDVLLIQNFIVNYFLLIITGKILKIKFSFWRLVLASFIGSLYIITFFLKNRYLTTMPIKLLVPLIMILISFPKEKIKFYLSSTVTYIILSMCLAGICIFLEGNNTKSLTYNGYLINFSSKGLVLSLIIFFLIGERMCTFIKSQIQVKALAYELDIYIHGELYSMQAFLDTGNELREPITNLPVIIAEEYNFQELIRREGDFYDIPYRVVSGSSGKLKGIKADYIIIKNSKGERQKKMAIIAFTKGKLCDDNKYNSLLSRGVI